MVRSKTTGRIVHFRRQVSTARPMHLTHHLVAGLPSLRTREVRAVFDELREGAAERGLDVVASALMGNHIHLLIVVERPEALADGTRYLFAQLARRLNKLWSRTGAVFVDRFYSGVCSSVVQAWNALNYVASNAFVAHCPEARRGPDPYTRVDAPLLESHPFLRTLVAGWPQGVPILIRRLLCSAVKYIPLAERRQPALPGLGR